MRIHSLHFYPVKGTHAVDVMERMVGASGLDGDRRWMVVDANGRFVTQREQPRLAQVRAQTVPGGLLLSAPGKADLSVPFPAKAAPVMPAVLWKQNVGAYNAGSEVDAWFSSFLGVPCKLVYQGDLQRLITTASSQDESSFADLAPVLVTSLASLEDLNRRMGKTLPMSRFRSNIVVEGADAWAEDTWLRLRIGTVELDVIKPCTRCVVTTIDQETGEKNDGNEPLGTLKNFRLIRQPGLTGVVFGQNAVPRETGTIRVGDKVEVLSIQPAPDYLAI